LEKQSGPEGYGFVRPRETKDRASSGEKAEHLRAAHSNGDSGASASKVSSLLADAVDILAERGKGYDGNEERSMGAIVKVFNTLTGYELSVSDGWLFMMTLKLVRAYGKIVAEKNAGNKEEALDPKDSLLDLICYTALLAEEEAKEREEESQGG
jgi:hypothetical protein